MRYAALVALALALSGCAASLQHATEVGGVANESWSLTNGAGDALALADAHCGKYGKAARVSGENILNNTLSFDCVAR